MASRLENELLMNIRRQLPTWLQWLNMPVPRPAAIIVLALGTAAVALMPLLLDDRVGWTNIVHVLYCAWGGIGLAIEYTRPKRDDSSVDRTGCWSTRWPHNRILGAWFVVSGIISCFVLGLILSIIVSR
jgi:hypothetical protein